MFSSSRGVLKSTSCQSLRSLGIVENGSIWNPLTKTGHDSSSGSVEWRCSSSCSYTVNAWTQTCDCPFRKDMPFFPTLRQDIYACHVCPILIVLKQHLLQRCRRTVTPENSPFLLFLSRVYRHWHVLSGVSPSRLPFRDWLCLIFSTENLSFFYPFQSVYRSASEKLRTWL